MSYMRNSAAGGGLMGQLPDVFGAFECELQNGEQQFIVRGVREQ